MHDFAGMVAAFQVTIDCDAKEPLPVKADVSFDFKDLKTGSKGRDKDMLKWLKYASNPKGSFHLSSWKQGGTNSVALGELTLNGVQQSIQLPTAIKREGDEMVITGTAKMDYRDFKLPVIRKELLFSVDPHLTVSFQIKGTLIHKL